MSLTPAQLAEKMRAAREALSGLGVSVAITLRGTGVTAAQVAVLLNVPVTRTVYLRDERRETELLQVVALGPVEAHEWCTATLDDCNGARVVRRGDCGPATDDEIAAAFESDPTLAPFCPRCGLQPSRFTGCECGKEARP